MSKTNPRDRNITIVVKANQLFNVDNPQNEEVIDAFTSLVEDGGLESGFGDANKTFETMVFMNKRICWSIQRSDPNGADKNYSVSLNKVFHNPTPGNPNFFTSDPLNVDQSTGKICGTISKNPNLPEKDDSYTIQFAIGFSKPGQSGMVLLNLDPKLRIKPSN